MRKSLVDAALLHLDKLSREADDDPQLQFELASAYDRVGRILGNPAEVNLGSTSQAAQSAKKAAALFDKAIATSPNNETWLIGAGGGYRRYAELLNLSNSREAKVAAVRAVDLGRKAVETGHDKQRYDNMRAALIRLGEYQRTEGDNAGALRSAEESLAISRRQAKEYPGLQSRRSLALAYGGRNPHAWRWRSRRRRGEPHQVQGYSRGNDGN